MRHALTLAERAADAGDVPVGALVVDASGEVVGEGWNRREVDQDPTAHAEVVALRAAADRVGSWRLEGFTLVATMEPCPMCAGALKLAGIGTLVLALRHARLQRTDLGHYDIEAFCRMTGFDLALRDGVLEDEYLALRLQWGGNAVRQPA